MSTGTDISALYHEFTDALTEILAENAVGPARRGRLARARAADRTLRRFALDLVLACQGFYEGDEIESFPIGQSDWKQQG